MMLSSTRRGKAAVQRAAWFHASSRTRYKLDRAADSPFRRSANNNKEAPPPPETSIPLSRALFRPVLVATSVGLASFGLAAIWDYENKQQQQQQTKQTDPEYFQDLNEIITPQASPQQASPQSTTNTTPLRIFSPAIPHDYRPWWNQEVLRDPRARQHTVGPLIVADFAVGSLVGMAEWRLGKDWCRTTSQGRALPILVAPFGHGGLLHLGITSMFLWKYGDHLVQKAGNKETFWAFFATAGTWASVGGILLDRARNHALGPPRQVFPTRKAPLFAFGAPYAVLYAYFFSCSEYQHKRKTVRLFGRDWGIPVAEAVLGLAVVDCLGLALGHRVFGNAIHLSGAVIGYYAVRMGGLEQVQAYQRKVVHHYVQWKGGPAEQDC